MGSLAGVGLSPQVMAQIKNIRFTYQSRFRMVAGFRNRVGFRVARREVEHHIAPHIAEFLSLVQRFAQHSSRILHGAW